MKSALFVLALLALSARPIAAQEIAAQEIAPPSMTIDTAIDVVDRMTVPVTIDGRGPFPFVVDTGADRTVVSRELATALGLAAGGPATMHSMSGVGQVSTVLVERLGVGGRTRDDELRAPALAEIHLGAKGLLGVDSLKGRRVVMDFARGTFSVTESRAVRERIDADMAVVGVGTTPNTDWLETSTLDVTNGVLCTPTCHAVGAPDVVACGDIARWPNLRFDDEPRRIEHWLNAIEMGQHAASSLLLGPERAEPFTPIPRFWSDQHGHRIQSVGMPDLGSMTISEGSTADRRFVATFDRDGRTVGAIAMDSPRRMIHYSEVIAQDCPVDLELAA